MIWTGYTGHTVMFRSFIWPAIRGASSPPSERCPEIGRMFSGTIKGRIQGGGGKRSVAKCHPPPLPKIWKRRGKGGKCGLINMRKRIGKLNWLRWFPKSIYNMYIFFPSQIGFPHPPPKKKYRFYPNHIRVKFPFSVIGFGGGHFEPCLYYFLYPLDIFS